MLVADEDIHVCACGMTANVLWMVVRTLMCHSSVLVTGDGTRIYAGGRCAVG